MKIRLTKSELEQIVSEAISVEMNFTDSIEWMANRPKCKEYLNKDVLPDNILAIFFGDQLLGAGVNKTPTQGFMKDAISNDTIARKFQDPDAVMRANKIEPSMADTIREWLAFAIDYAFGPLSESFCMLIAAAVEYATKLMDAFGVDNKLNPGAGAGAAVGTGAVAGAAVASAQAQVDILPEVESMYTKMAQTDYFAKLNRGRITGVTPMDFFFFPFSMGALSSGNPDNLSEVVLESDLKALRDKLRNVKKVGKFRDFFEDFTEAAFYNPVTKSSREVRIICKTEINVVTSKLKAEGAESQYENISNAIKQDFAQKTRNHMGRFQQMLSKLPKGPQLLQLFSKYSLI